jgi:hypothetical protein
MPYDLLVLENSMGTTADALATATVHRSPAYSHARSTLTSIVPRAWAIWRQAIKKLADLLLLIFTVVLTNLQQLINWLCALAFFLFGVQRNFLNGFVSS